MAKPRLQHTTIIIHEDGQETARAFYGGLLGLEEKDPPRALAHLQVVWFVVGDEQTELHCSPNGPQPRENEQHHFCLAVDNLDEYRTRLRDAGVEIVEAAETIPTRPRFFCRDPFGNLVELTLVEGDYHNAQ